MKRLSILFTLVLVCCTWPVSAQQPIGNNSLHVMPLCAILADAAKYEGKEIVVRGLYRMVIHGTILMDRNCSETDVNLRGAPGYKADKHALAVLRSLTKKDEFRPVDVVLRGTFLVAHGGQCFSEMCAPYEIETTALVSARPESPAEGGATTQR